MTQKWGLSFDINTEPGPAGRSAGSLAWAGLFNIWLDPNKRVTGTIMTQLLPFADDQLLKLFTKFERGLYAAVAFRVHRFGVSKMSRSGPILKCPMRADGLAF
jgi:hypothetical protein